MQTCWPFTDKQNVTLATMSVLEKILINLSDGRFHSGEKLASEFNLTRAAIWKNIKLLQSRYGIEVDAVTGKGYRIFPRLELLDVNTITEHLPPGTPVPGVEVLLSVDSTNRYLMQKLKTGARNTQAVFAEHQSAGRGRQGRKWISPFGSNLYFSVLHQFENLPRDITGLSLAIGITLVEYLKQTGIDTACLKWPNDILVNGRKLCGILLELQGESHGPQSIVVGVGFNVSMPSNVATEIDQPWIALSTLTSAPVSRNKLAAELLARIMTTLNKFEQQGLEPFAQRWSQSDCYLNTTITLQLGEKKLRGVARGIDHQGALLLESNGKLDRFYSGEIQTIRPVTE